MIFYIQIAETDESVGARELRELLYSYFFCF